MRLLDQGPPKYSTALFSLAGLKKYLPVQLSRFLLVAFTEGDGLPQSVRQNCEAKAESIECKLHKLNELAQDSCLSNSRSLYKEASVLRTLWCWSFSLHSASAASSEEARVPVKLFQLVPP